MMQDSNVRHELESFGVSRETMELIEQFVAILDEWRQHMNLIGPREMEQLWMRHIVDSAQLIPLMSSGPRIADLGSGAGFPGLVLACQAASTGGYVTMVESTAKKCAFLQDVITRLKLPARIQNTRIEAARSEPVDFITARALAPLPRLIEYAYPWLKSGATGLFFKGEKWQQELTDASDCWTLGHEAIPSRTSAAGVILKIKEAHRV